MHAGLSLALNLNTHVIKPLKYLVKLNLSVSFVQRFSFALLFILVIFQAVLHVLNETLGLPSSHSVELCRGLRGLSFVARSVFLVLHRRLASHKDVILHHGLTVLDMMRYFHLFLFIKELFVLLLVSSNYLLSHSE